MHKSDLTPMLQIGGSLRVIAGSAKGTRLYGAKGQRIRPVLDRVKESLFDVLGDRVQGVRVLDMFAGVGNLGIEALSRGAGHADFIEQHRATAGAITANLERAHLSDRATVRALKLPRGLLAAHGPYGLIFVDPPFRIDKRLLEALFHLMSEGGVLDVGGLLIYRHSPHSSYEPPGGAWSLVERRDYGDSIISIYGSNEETDGTGRS
jgi:16S rRNA (guanine966-N2)-methyltransferase